MMLFFSVVMNKIIKKYHKKIIPIEISARHCHLSSEHLAILFGDSHKLAVSKRLSQPGQFAAREKITLKTKFGKIENITVVGPVRKQTQIEISVTDARKLGLRPPVRLSGDLKGSVGAQVIGSGGKIDITKGIIIAARHIHCDPTTASKLGLENQDYVSVEIEGERSLTFHRVALRVNDNFRLSFHIDTDEANAFFSNKTIAKATIVY